MTNTISLIFNSQAGCKEALLNWIKQKNLTNPIFITDENNLLNISPCISIAELIPIMSETEEAIYRLHYHYRRFFAKQFPIYSQKINLIADELHAYRFEIAARCLAAFLSVKDQYQDVIFIFSQSDMALILQLTALIKVTQQNCMTRQENVVIFDEKMQCFKTVKRGFYGFYVRSTLVALLHKYQALLSSPPLKKGAESVASGGFYIFKSHRRANNASPPSREQARPPFSKGAARPLLFITTSAALHRRNFKPVYEALSKELNSTPLAIAITKKAEGFAREDGIVLTPLPSSKGLFCSYKFCMRAVAVMIKSSVLKLIYVQRIKRLTVVILRRVTTKDLPITRRSFPRFCGDKLAKNAPQDDSTNQKALFLQQLIILLSQQGLLARLLRSLIKIEQMDRCFKEHQPTIIYKNVAASPYDNRLAFIAKNYGIPVTTSIVASISNRYRNFGIFPCDFVTLLGDNQKPIMYKRGYSNQQLICVGQPELDIARVDSSYQSDVFTILIATGYVNLYEERIWITALNEFAERSTFPLQILLKPHPSAQNFYTTLNHLQHIHILPIYADIYACFTVAQLIITDVSHVGKLAIYFEKPLMVINFSDRDFPFNNYAQDYVAWLATDETTMTQIIENIHHRKLQINQQAYKTYIRQHLTNNDQQACKRIVNFLLAPNYP